MSEGLEFYKSIHELPNIRRGAATVASLWSDNVGNELDDIRNNVVRAFEMLINDRKEDALRLLQNADMGFEALNSAEHFKSRELACYAKGYPLKLSEEDIDEISNIINHTMTYEQIGETLLDIKKK